MTQVVGIVRTSQKIKTAGGRLRTSSSYKWYQRVCRGGCPSFLHVFTSVLISIYCVPGNTVDIGDKVVDKADENH
jgi:hypothetical protein